MEDNQTTTKTNYFLSRKTVLLLLLLLAFRVLVVVSTINNIPPTSEIQSGLWFYNGADGDYYFDSTKMMLQGKLSPGAEPTGLSIIYAPIIYFTHAQTLNDIIALMAVIYGIIFSIIVTIMVYILAKKFLKDPRKALLIAALFQIYPYLFYLFFHYFAGTSDIISQFTSSRFIQLSFLQIGSDPWSMILTISSLFVLFKISDNSKTGEGKGVLLGPLTGWAAITRLQNFILLPFYGFILLYYKKYRCLIYYILGTIPLLLIQAYFNWMISGSIFKLSTFQFMDKIPNVPPLFSLTHPIRLILYPLKYNPWLFLPMILGAALIIFGMVLITKRNGRSGTILVVYTLTIISFLFFLWPSYMNPRYFLPVIPALFIYTYAAAEKLFFIALRRNYGK